MMKITNKLRIALLIIAVLAVVVHMVIPHDHHPAELFACEDTECPVSDSTDDHNTGVPVHCHACNDLTSEKSVIMVVVNHFESKCFLACGNDNCRKPVLPEAFFTGNAITRKHSDSDYPDIYLLRAPPSII